MKNQTIAKVSRAVLALVLAVTVLSGVMAMPQQAAAATYDASHITRNENLTVNYQDYLNSSVMFALPDTVKDDQEISVIITMDLPTLMESYELTDKSESFTDYALYSQEAAAVSQRILDEKVQILARLDEKEIAYTTGEDYDTLLSGFEILIQASDYALVCQSLGDGEKATVGEEYQAMETQLVENTVNVYETGIFKSGDSGYDGTGMVVAVLDTGLDSNHSAFSISNFTSDHLGLTYEDVAAVLNRTKAYELAGGLSVDDVYINEKVPFGYDYADNDPDPYSTHNNHGTHVSGVIVGKDDTITGVAPNAQLVSMKTFSDVMDTARSTWILSALEDCVVLGVDVINMSLGTAAGFSTESEEEILNGVYDKIREAGISMVVAASNSYSSAYGSEANGNLPLTSNPDTGTVGSPSTYDGVLSVASINGEETPYLLYDKTIIYFDESNTAAAEENDFCATLLGDQDEIEIEYVIIPGVGRSADYTGMDVQGKIALVRRGDNTFEEKAMIAEEQGAAGIIIYNNVSGEIKMNVGDAKLATCSISQNDGEMLVAAGGGKLKISKDQSSGPFISDFSSWGPGPGLEIKPEITAHGGNILSSVTGGGYDRLSGTSMACPNLAGVVILLRQYVVENFPDIANDNVKVNEMVNKLMMSTADIALNTNGLPYAVRKQGAGLANLMNSINTTAYITTYDASGSAMDKTKLELGDDPEKTGVYELTFSVVNFGEKDLAFEVGSYVLTEGVSETKTNAGKVTVTEEAYALSGQAILTSINGEETTGTKVNVEAGSETKVTMIITLSEEDKTYMDANFENGMYVEGYVTLTATKGTDINLNVPYLAFYGDWTQAPMFDLTYYDTNADELDDGIDEEDKTKADAYATRPIGGVEDDYVSYLGSYYFIQDETDIPIPANEDYVALSNQEGTIHALRYVWAGLLRSADNMVITITDDTTGEVIFETEDDQVRKSYGDGGSIYPANIEVEFDTMDYNLMNNSQYTVHVEGTMDYEGGGVDTNKKNSFTFPLYIDFEAPTITDVQFRYEYDKTLEKNRLYADVYVYDNHYAMSTQLGYVGMGEDEEGNETPELFNYEQYMTPVYSKRNSTTMVTYELTDYVHKLKEEAINPNTFVVTCYDYALNYATYEIGMPDDYEDFYFDGLEEGLTLSPNEVYSLSPLTYPDNAWGELLEYTSSKPSVARIVNDKIVASGSGNANIKVRDPETNKSITFPLTVLSEEDEGYRRYDKPVADVFKLTGYDTIKAYYQLDNNDKDIGDTGETRYFDGNYNLSLYPSESVKLNYVLDAFFPNDTTVEFTSSNENIVTISEDGTVVGKAEGFASVTVKVLMDDRSTYYSESVDVEVKDPYITTGPSLTHYFGNGGTVTIPEDLHLTEIGNFSFANFDYVLKTEEELAFDDAEATKQWYIGEATITKVIIPEGIEKIGAYAFANLTALEEVVLPSTLQSIEYGAFYGCSALETISFSSENNVQIISQNAFENCDLQGELDLSAACVISNYAFAGNQHLESVITSDALLSIGEYAFAGCKEMETFTVTADKVKYGPYAFTGCQALTSFRVNAAVLPEGMFYECDELTEVTVGPDVNEIGEFAFRDTAIANFTVESGNKAYKAQTASYIVSADGATLYAVAPTVTGEFTANQAGNETITAIGRGAFSHNTKIDSVVLPKVTTIGNYGLGSAEKINSVSFGMLTDIGEYAFFETAITQLPAMNSDVTIGKYAFAYTALTDVQIPDGMILAEGVFAQCKQLERVTIGNDVTVGDYAFNMDKDESFDIYNYDDEQTGEKYFYYDFSSALTELTIGNNAVIGENAFAGHASLTSVTLGEGAELGYMAFYNCTDLAEIDLSKVKVIGDYALSGDVYYICLDDAMSVAAVSPEGQYMYTYHAPAITEANLSSAESIGEYAFAYCRNMTDVVLNDTITEIPQYAFASCIALQNIDLSKVVTIGDYAFMESEQLVAVDVSAAETIGEYAFVNGKALAEVKLNPNGCELAEGVFAYCELLTAPENLNKVKVVGDYAFAYAGIVEADLSGAEHIGTHAFLKEELTDFTVTLGEKLKTLGDNPFAMCKVAPFAMEQVETFNGTDRTQILYTYDISDSIHVIDGSLYAEAENGGYELIAYAGADHTNQKVADGTVRIGAYAFAGSDVERITLPYTTTSLGHKAFFGCESLEYVVFKSYYAPILEEEFDSTYYETYDHVPGTGDYGSYTDYDGTEVVIDGMGLLPYYMWNATGGMYSNIFYGANFNDYIGFVERKLTMVRPANGQGYDSFIMNQYFDLVIDGPNAADDVTLAAIAAINAIPERVAFEHKAIVEAAREAYSKVATIEQQALVSNYGVLVSAEQRVIALDPANQEVVEQVPAEEEKSANKAGYIVAGAIVIVLALLLVSDKVIFADYKGFFAKIKAIDWKAQLAKVKNFFAKVGAWFAKIGKRVFAKKAKKAAEETAEESEETCEEPCAEESAQEEPCEQACEEEQQEEVEE